MRPNRWVLLVSFVVGVAGLWSYLTAIGDYRTTADAYTSVDADYVLGSFVWLDDEYRTAEADFTISNDSRAGATVDFLVLRLYFDGAFAGAQYRPWSAVDVPRGSRETITIPFEVAIESERSRALEAALSVRGEMQLVFEGIEQALTVDINERIGEVSEIGN